VAGSNSVSIATGETFASKTKMSGRSLLSRSMPVFSDRTVWGNLQALLVVRSCSANASLMVCSVVGIRQLVTDYVGRVLR
jgi:hypothetical protein